MVHVRAYFDGPKAAKFPLSVASRTENLGATRAGQHRQRAGGLRIHVSKVSEHYTQLATAMYKTRGARFHAAARLQVREKCGNGIIAYLSLYLVGLSITSTTFSGQFTQADNQFIMVLTIVVSLAVVIFALLEYASSLGTKSERLHANALQISALMRQLEGELVRDPLRLDQMEAISEKV